MKNRMDPDFETTQLSPLQATPHHDCGRVPPGGIVCHPKWKGSELVKAMQGRVRIVYEDNTSIVDFHPAHDMAVIYISEGDLLTGSTYRKKLAKLRKAQKLKGIVLVDKTPMTEQYFMDVQKFVVLELGFVLLPITCQTEAGNLLVQLVNEENKPSDNPFVMRHSDRDLTHEKSVLVTVQMIPKLGSVKGKALLKRFKSIHGIQTASLEELTSVIGKINAHHVKTFFEQNTKLS